MGKRGLVEPRDGADSSGMTTLELPRPARATRGEAKTIRRIFHPCDLSAGDEQAFLHALRIALAAKGELEIMHVSQGSRGFRWPEFPSVTGPLARWGFLAEGAREEELEDLGLEVVKAQYCGENAYSRIAGVLSAHRPDLTVLATHQRRGWNRLLHGSMAEPIAREAEGLTLFVPRGCEGFVSARTGEVKLKNVLVPVEKSGAKGAFEAAALLPTLLRAVDTHFTFLYVGEESAAPDPHARMRWAWTSERRAWKGEVVGHICDTARATGADLIVMRTGGHHGVVDAALGSITERVVREATCPVLAAPRR